MTLWSGGHPILLAKEVPTQPQETLGKLLGEQQEQTQAGLRSGRHSLMPRSA